MLREKRQRIKIFYVFVDFFLSYFAVIIATVLHFYLFSPEKRLFFIPDTQGYFRPGVWFADNEFLAIFTTYSVLGIIYAFSQILVFIALDVYQPRRLVEPVKETLYMMRGIVINVILVLALLFFYREHSYSRLVVVYTVIINVILLSAGHYFIRLYNYRLIKKGKLTRNLLIIGANQGTERILHFIEKYKLFGFKLAGILKNGRENTINENIMPYLIGEIQDLPRVLANQHIDTVIMFLGDNQREYLDVLKVCDREGIDCIIVPDVVELLTHKARVEIIEGLPVFILRDIPLRNGYNQFLKRMFDIIFSLIVIVITLPLMVIIAILVKISSKGPVFFIQERVGLDRKKFKLIKFRTMYVQDQVTSDTTWGKKNDPRVTPVGRFLRKTSLDELPQFFNVLKGDMSVVGPRPERPHFVEKFKQQYEKYMLRHAVKSGITGLAQIMGYRGDTSIEKRVEADIYYIENWSLLLDVIIILKTIPALFKNPGE